MFVLFTLCMFVCLCFFVTSSSLIILFLLSVFNVFFYLHVGEDTVNMIQKFLLVDQVFIIIFFVINYSHKILVTRKHKFLLVLIFHKL